MTYYIQKSNFVKNLLKLQLESDRSWLTGLQSLDTIWTFFRLLIFMIFFRFFGIRSFLRLKKFSGLAKPIGILFEDRNFSYQIIFEIQFRKILELELFWGQINFWSRKFFCNFWLEKFGHEHFIWVDFFLKKKFWRSKNFRVYNFWDAITRS